MTVCMYVLVNAKKNTANVYAEQTAQIGVEGSVPDALLDATEL